ncbi:hypothetical protein TUBRATIS_23200 [Tubulinosema ratisbonensis]|uniref:Uncharacterized protein n=1 Tax=Tubulinosema ratisbonensis TaxID=291195 RepID=A0A437AJN5_9MICR|nr:hypothetical protein TUBRATIS_23200 [Tubulinosema ratisbonensis]
MSVILLCFSFIFSYITLNDHVIISLSDEPDWHITVEDTLVRIKKIKKDAYEEFDSNIAKIFLDNGRYQINYQGLYLFAEENNKEITAKEEDKKDDGFNFNIITTEFGQKIFHDDMCLQKGPWDTLLLGYKLIEEKCSDNEYQYFDIKKYVKRIKDNNDENAQVFIHDRNSFNKVKF